MECRVAMSAWVRIKTQFVFFAQVFPIIMLPLHSIVCKDSLSFSRIIDFLLSLSLSLLVSILSYGVERYFSPSKPWEKRDISSLFLSICSLSPLLTIIGDLFSCLRRRGFIVYGDFHCDSLSTHTVLQAILLHKEIAYFFNSSGQTEQNLTLLYFKICRIHFQIDNLSEYGLAYISK